LSRFQWASLQIDFLLALDLEENISTALGELPETLEKAYDEVFSRIDNQQHGSSTTKIAYRAFKWVMCSVVPMKPEMLKWAVCQSPEQHTITVPGPGIDIQYILNACLNLLVVDSSAGVCRFSHLSVQEYIEKRKKKIEVYEKGVVKNYDVEKGLWTVAQANGYAASVCLALLNDFSVYDTSSSKNKFDRTEFDPRTSFLNYVFEYWYIHVRASNGKSDYDDSAEHMASLLEKFLRRKGRNRNGYDEWYRICRRKAGSQAAWRPGKQLIENAETQGEFAIAQFGFTWFLLLQLDGNLINVNQMNDQGKSLLTVAILEDRIDTVELLLRAGADVNLQGGKYHTALQAAAHHGNSKTIELLLKAGANVNIYGGHFGSAFQAAASRGNITNIKLLLKAGADVHVQGGYFGSPLMAAAYRGNCATIGILLRTGAKINTQCGHYGTALQAAAYQGHIETVELLLRSGAEANAQGGYHGAALHAAAHQGNNSIVVLLLKAGADIDLQCGYYGGALQAAAYQGHRATTRLLLVAGADVNAQGGQYVTALRASIHKGDKQTTRLLLEAGAKG
jgi:ankyrin repeat protein